MSKGDSSFLLKEFIKFKKMRFQTNDILESNHLYLLTSYISLYNKCKNRSLKKEILTILKERYRYNMLTNFGLNISKTTWYSHGRFHIDKPLINLNSFNMRILSDHPTIGSWKDDNDMDEIIQNLKSISINNKRKRKTKTYESRKKRKYKITQKDIIFGNKNHSKISLLKNLIENFFLKNSNPAANRLIKGIPVRMVNDSILNLFSKYNKENSNNKCSYSTFLKYKQFFIRKGKRKTDMCSICEKGKILHTKLSKKQYNTIAEKVKIERSIKLIKLHQEINQIQSEKFKKDISTVKDGDCNFELFL